MNARLRMAVSTTAFAKEKRPENFFANLAAPSSLGAARFLLCERPTSNAVAVPGRAPFRRRVLQRDHEGAHQHERHKAVSTGTPLAQHRLNEAQRGGMARPGIISSAPKIGADAMPLLGPS